MNILLTGAHGFLGHHLVDKIAREIDEISYQLFTPHSHELDCLKYTELYHYCQYKNIDAIIHLAAECGGIGINQRKPADFFLNNAQMSLNVLKACYHRYRLFLPQTYPRSLQGRGFMERLSRRD